MHDDLGPLRPRDELAEGVVLHGGDDVVGDGGLEAFHGRQGGVAQDLGGLGQGGVPGDAAAGPGEQAGALLQDEVRVGVEGEFHVGDVEPGGEGVAPGLDGEGPLTFTGQADLGLVAVGPRGLLAHRDERLPASSGGVDDNARREGVVPFADHGRADGETFFGDRFHRTEVVLWRDIEDGQSSDHWLHRHCRGSGVIGQHAVTRVRK